MANIHTNGAVFVPIAGVEQELVANPKPIVCIECQGEIVVSIFHPAIGQMLCEVDNQFILDFADALRAAKAFRESAAAQAAAHGQTLQ
jgi:hypothetical protein